MGEIHELFVLALSLVWFAGATPENFFGPETGWGGGLPRKGVVAEKFGLSLESLSSLVSEERNLGCPGNFAGMSRTPGGVQKVCAKKVRAHFSFPNLGCFNLEPKPKLFGPDSVGWGGGLPREGVGAKKFGMSFEAQGNQTFWRDIPILFCRDLPGAPEKFEKKRFVFDSLPLFGPANFKKIAGNFLCEI